MRDGCDGCYGFSSVHGVKLNSAGLQISKNEKIIASLRVASEIHEKNAMDLADQLEAVTVRLQVLSDKVDSLEDRCANEKKQKELFKRHYFAALLSCSGLAAPVPMEQRCAAFPICSSAARGMSSSALSGEQRCSWPEQAAHFPYVAALLGAHFLK